ncbi:hypothetical protein Cha6605_3843 [Chamaesiphon minutus PCC 6605]|uniref:Rho termination factor-like N-terminal domain-containing protein n=2 Tax=Chamaesiphon TaxID=217161 RepID=K9UJJ7_CHAP6|nr:hypothetical protein Cha6605_3843 [Chamaesiphon minutus PCC 6605]
MTIDNALEEMTLRQLRRVASVCGVSRYSRMRKSQLLEEIQKIQSKSTQSPSTKLEAQLEVEAGKFELGVDVDLTAEELAAVDEGLGDLPGGYGDSRIVLLPRDPQWAYAYWDIPIEHKNELRYHGGQQLALRIYDVTDINLEHQSPHSIQEYPIDEMAREWYLPIPVSDRSYTIDIGYRCGDGRWLILARSASVNIPPVYPSDWIEDIFITVPWEEQLIGKTFVELVPPSHKAGDTSTSGTTNATGENAIYERIFGMADSVESLRIAGSLYGSMQQSPLESLSSFVFPSGAGMWALPTASGVNMSGVGMSGIGMDVGERQRQFWLIADAELIVYGATEPDATVSIGGRQIKLNPDGTFRFQMSFQDGNIDYPIVAVAKDGEQQRSVHMTFDRATPSRNTNTKEEAVPEKWF